MGPLGTGTGPRSPRPPGLPGPQVQQLERSIGLKDLAMADLEQKVHEMEASTFDGVFVWKISDFTRKRQEAVAGRTPAIFSPGAVWNVRPHVPVLPPQPPLSLSRPAEARSRCASLRAGNGDQPSCGGSSTPNWAPGPL